MVHDVNNPYLDTKRVLYKPRFTLWPRLLQWRTPSMEEKVTWMSTWQHFMLWEFSRSSYLDKSQTLGQET